MDNQAEQEGELTPEALLEKARSLSETPTDLLHWTKALKFPATVAGCLAALREVGDVVNFLRLLRVDAEWKCVLGKGRGAQLIWTALLTSVDNVENLEFTGKWTSDLIKEMCTNHAGITSLSLHVPFRNYAYGTVLEDLSLLPNLDKLYLGGLGKSVNCIRYPSELPIRILRLNSWDAGNIKYLTRGCRNLMRLELTLKSIVSIGPKGLEEIVESCPKLDEFNIGILKWREIHRDEINWILATDMFPDLPQIKFLYVLNINVEKTLLSKFKNLRKFSQKFKETPRKDVDIDFSGLSRLESIKLDFKISSMSEVTIKSMESCPLLSLSGGIPGVHVRRLLRTIPTLGYVGTPGYTVREHHVDILKRAVKGRHVSVVCNFDVSELDLILRRSLRRSKITLTRATQPSPHQPWLDNDPPYLTFVIHKLPKD